MKDLDWIGRLVEFREPLTLRQSFYNCRSAIIYSGRIKKVFRTHYLFAEVEAIFEKPLLIGHYNIRPNPNRIAQEWYRKKHHKSKIYIKPRFTGWRKSDNKKFLIRLKRNQTRWKPVRFNDPHLSINELKLYGLVI